MRKKLVLLTVLLAACLVVSGCGPSAEQSATLTAVAWTATPSQTATPTQTATPSPTSTPFEFDYDAILEKLITDLKMPSDRKAFLDILVQYESMVLGEFVASAPTDSEGGPWFTYFIATQNGGETTVSLRGTETFTKGIESLYANGLISQVVYSILK